MAGDWLKIEKCTPEKPEVYAIADRLGVSRREVFGGLFLVWSWFDSHTEDGSSPSVTMKSLDEVAGVPGLAKAMDSVGWLKENGTRIRLPNFGRHMGTTAKARAMGKLRVEKHRNATSVTKELPEKRRGREENRTSRAHHEAREGKAMVGDIAGVGSREDGWDGVVEAVLGLGEAWAGIGRERVVETVRNAGSVDAAWRAVRYLRGLVSAGEPVNNARKLLARAMALEGEREAKADASRREEQEAVRQSKERTARMVEEQRALRAVVVAEMDAAKGEGAKREDGWDGVVETVLGLGEAWAGIGRERVVDTVRNAGSVDAAWRAVRYLRGLVSAGEPVSNARKLLARAMALEGEREAKADASRREEQEAVRRSKEETARRVEEKRARRALVLAEIEAAKGEGAKVEAAKRDGER